jgi:pimeloyl-ACP methyl ester carboxylesterase
MQSVTSADGTRIVYERHGDGQPLVLVHGGSKPQFWMPVVPRLADEYAVVVPRRRGHGESGDGDDYSLRREVEDVSAVLDAVDGDPVLFGHSFGGLVALETARVSPVERLVAYEPGVLVGEYREQADLAAKMQAKLDDGDPVEATKVYVREVIHGGAVDDLDAWLAEWPPWPGLVDLAENLTRMNRAIESYRLPETIHVDAPTLLLTGTQGPPHLRESVREVHAALPESDLVEFDGVSHSGPVEAPDRVLGAVRDFVEGAQTPTTQ